MISDALHILDSIINLAKSSRESQRRLFEDHIEPIFLDLTTIHNNYTESFEKLLEEYRHIPHSTDLMNEIVKKKKSELEYLRIKAHEMAKAFNEDELSRLPSEASEFFTSVRNYLGSASGMFRTYHGHFSDLLDFMKESEFTLKENSTAKYPAMSMVYKYRTESGQLVGDDLGYKMYTVNENVKNGWTAVTSAYAKARMKLLK